MHHTSAKRPTNLDASSPIHLVRGNDRLCPGRSGLGALWRDGDSKVVFRAGDGDRPTNMRWTLSPKHVTCDECLARMGASWLARSTHAREVYVLTTRALRSGRRIGVVSESAEEQFTETLDVCWQRMSQRDREAVEELLLDET